MNNTFKRIRVLGGGWYGCHIAHYLSRVGCYDVHLHEIGPRLFNGASGNNPARLHLGFHYPRSFLTRRACLMHNGEFMDEYGSITRSVPINIYAIAARDSLVDWGTYRKILDREVSYVPIPNPIEYGLYNVEGAMLTGERHILIDDARDLFRGLLGNHVKYNRPPGTVDSDKWDMTIDCTFCAMDSLAVDRYEPCMMVLMGGPTDKAVTIMDGPFPSLYPWSEKQGLCSLTSASLTPLRKDCRTYEEARQVLDDIGINPLLDRSQKMVEQMAEFWPDFTNHYKFKDTRLSIRAMPRSGADARLVDVVRIGKHAMRVRAGKIDAIFDAARQIKCMLEG